VVAPAIAVASLAWLAALIVTPFAPASFATAVYAVCGVICHQIPERSFHLTGFQLPVCARCLGIYAGAALGACGFVLGGILSGWTMPWRTLSAQAARRVFLVSAAPTLVTVGLEWSGYWSGTNIVRSIAGIALGAGGALVVMSAVATLHYTACQRRRLTGPCQIPPPI
jgi:uncharacterized membrane protein